MPRRTAKPPCVSLVSGNAETLATLKAYLVDSGLDARATAEIDDLPTIFAATTAVVLFPDDFGNADVLTTIRALRRARPKVLLVVVTRDPRRSASVCSADDRSTAPIVLPKPSFGWSILDAIRAHLADLAQHTKTEAP